MIEKKPTDDGTAVRVTFVVPSDHVNGDVSIAGEFNGWDVTATPMRTTGSRLEATLTLEAGRRYAFRYLCDGRWFNDDAADAYEPNELGGYNCVIDLTDAD